MNKFLRRQLGIKKAKRLIKANPNWRDSFRILIKTRVPCSCYMCGHRREYFGKTHQEILADIDWEEQQIENAAIWDFWKFENED